MESKTQYDWTNVRSPFTEDEVSKLSEGMAGTPVWEHWGKFVEVWALSRKSISTVRNVRDAIRLFAIYGRLTTLESWSDQDAVFDTMHRLQKERNWSASSFNSYRKNANTYFIFLVRRKLMAENPVARIEKMREKLLNYSVPEKEDFAKMFAFLQNRECTNMMQRKRDLLFFHLLITTGARPQELLNLKLENVADRKTLTIDGIKLGGKPRTYPLPTVIADALHDYIREVAALGRSRELDWRLFLGVKGSLPWTYAWMKKLIERVNEGAKLENKITCYSFRRNVATSLFRNGMPLERISKQLGHSRTATTMRYVQNLPEINRDAMNMMMTEYVPIMP